MVYNFQKDEGEHLMPLILIMTDMLTGNIFRVERKTFMNIIYGDVTCQK